MRNRFMGSVLALCAVVVMCGGCYDTMFRLAPIADAKVDRSLCGDWLLRSSSGSEIRLSVRNLDDQSYAVAWRSIDSGEVLMMLADSTCVEDALFIHARGLPEDGTLADTHLIVRVEVEGDRMTLRNLDDGFMNARGIDSDVSLRRVIEENLDNNDLYDDKPFTGTRVSREEP